MKRAMIAAAFAMSASYAMLGRSPAQPPAFDVASIKPNNSGNNAIGGAGVCLSSGGVSVRNFPLNLLIEQAYGIKEFQLLGRPDWFTSERFDIEARAGSRVGSVECKMMVRTLLADRFRLALHRDTRQLRIHTLAVGKNGPKLHKVDADAPLGIKTFDSRKGQLITRGTTMAQLAGMLAMTEELETVVEDGTGLDGYYEFTLEWTPGAALDAPKPSLFTALQEQLGLKLVSGKGMVEVFIIDRIERVPTEN